MTDVSRRQFGALAVGAALFSKSKAGAAAMAIDEGLFVEINGLEQWITIRGRDAANPVLLILHGGPGFPMSFMAPALADWEKDYTLVQWDQPAGGATYAKTPTAQGPLTIERFVRDGLTVAEYVAARFPRRPIVLMGTSWGSLLGLTMIHRRPELFRAYVGAGQVVSGPDGHRLGYELGLTAARARGDAAAIAALEKVGPPPYARFEDFLVRQTYTNPPGLPPTPKEAAATAELGRKLAAPVPADARYVARGLPQPNFMEVFMATQRQTFAEVATWEARALGLDFKVPVLVIQGDHDLNTPLPLVRDWLDKIHAPHKALEVIEGAGHNVFAFEAELHSLLNKHVRPLLAA